MKGQQEKNKDEKTLLISLHDFLFIQKSRNGVVGIQGLSVI